MDAVSIFFKLKIVVWRKMSEQNPYFVIAEILAVLSGTVIVAASLHYSMASNTLTLLAASYQSGVNLVIFEDLIRKATTVYVMCMSLGGFFLVGSIFSLFVGLKKNDNY